MLRCDKIYEHLASHKAPPTTIQHRKSSQLEHKEVIATNRDRGSVSHEASSPGTTQVNEKSFDRLMII